MPYGANVPREDAGAVDFWFIPTDASGDVIAGWTDTYIDIFFMDPSGNAECALVDQQMSETTHSICPYAANKIFHYRWQQDHSALSSASELLCVVFKSTTGDSTKKLYGIVSLTRETQFKNDLVAIGERLTLMYNHATNVMQEKIQRVLCLLGENLVLDQFEYDDAGNIDAYRMRIFEDSSSAEAATEDITGSLESGEIARYTVEQTTDLPKNLRSFHVSSIDTDQSDTAQTDTSWPTGDNVVD